MFAMGSPSPDRRKNDRGAATSDRRRFMRHTFDSQEQVLITLPDGNGPSLRLTVTPRDLSATGFGFVCDEELSIGVRCVIHLPLADGRNLTLHGRVRRCRKAADENYEAAIQLSSPIDPRHFTAEGSRFP